MRGALIIKKKEKTRKIILHRSKRLAVDCPAVRERSRTFANFHEHPWMQKRGELATRPGLAVCCLLVEIGSQVWGGGCPRTFMNVRERP
jgi:hypothetical protein